MYALTIILPRQNTSGCPMNIINDYKHCCGDDSSQKLKGEARDREGNNTGSREKNKTKQKQRRG